MKDLSQREKQRFRNVIDAATGSDYSGDLDQCNLAHLFNDDGMLDDSDALLVSRLDALSRVFRMAMDCAWGLPRLDQKRIIGTYHYLAAHNEGAMSSIEWTILRSAAIELLEHDCHAEIQMYNEFCDLRHGKKELPYKVETRPDWLRYKREELHRIGRRRFLGMRRSKVNQ